VPAPLDSAAYVWLIRYSLTVSRVDMATAEATRDRFATRLDGAGSTAATVTRRRRSVFGAYLKFAVRSGRLAADPLSASDWKPPRVDREVSPDLVVTLNEARALLDAAEHGGKRGSSRPCTSLG
jgi:site-specific recombinase XerC